MSIFRIVNKTISGKVEKQNHVHRKICTTETLYYSCTLNDVTMTKPVSLTFTDICFKQSKAGLIISTIRGRGGKLFFLINYESHNSIVSCE